MIKPSLALLFLLGAASAASADTVADRQARALAKALEGKVPGKPQACVTMNLGSEGPHAVTDSVLIYRVNRDLVYRNDLSNACTGISRGQTLLLKPTNNQYCRGDIAHSVDLTIGMNTGSCALGDFVPYRTPGK